jgi:tetratricopeptide (TPR) repeat protein
MLRSDPKQLVNRYGEPEAEEADKLFARFQRAWPPSQDPMALSDTERAQLEALGYITRATGAAAASTIDPKDRVTVFELLTSTSNAPGEERLSIAEQAAKRHGPVPALMLYIADLLDALGRPKDALAAVESAAKAHPEDRDLQRERLQRVQKLNALSALASAIQDRLGQHPNDLVALQDMALTLHRLQDFAGAERHYRQVLNADSGNDEVRIGLARALASQERFDHALAALAPALQRPGHSTQVDCTAGKIMARGLDRSTEAERLLKACDPGPNAASD